MKQGEWVGGASLLLNLKMKQTGKTNILIWCLQKQKKMSI